MFLFCPWQMITSLLPCFPHGGLDLLDLFAHWHSQSFGPGLFISFVLWWIPWQRHRKWLWGSIKPLGRGSPVRQVKFHGQGNRQCQSLLQFMALWRRIHLKPVTYKVMFLKRNTITGHRCYRKPMFTQLQPKALLARIYVVKGKVFSGQ